MCIVLAWFIGSLMSPTNLSKYGSLRYHVVELFKIYDFDDSDLQASAANVLSIVSNVTFPLRLASNAMKMFLEILDSNDLKWQVKIRLIPVIQSQFFRHLTVLSTEMKSEVLNKIAGLLEDSQVEVRNLAGTTLSGLILCSERAAIEGLKVCLVGLLYFC